MLRILPCHSPPRGLTHMIPRSDEISAPARKDSHPTNDRDGNGEGRRRGGARERNVPPPLVLWYSYSLTFISYSLKKEEIFICGFHPCVLISHTGDVDGPSHQIRASRVGGIFQVSFPSSFCWGIFPSCDL